MSVWIKRHNPFAVVDLLNARLASTRTSSLFGVLSTLFGKEHSGKEDMAAYINEFQQLFIHLKQIRSEASLEDFKALLLAFSLERNSVLEKSIAPLWTKDLKILLRQEETSELIAKWKVLWTEKDHNSSPCSEPSTARIVGSAVKVKKNRSNNSLWLLWKKCHSTQGCFINPEFPDCVLPEKPKRSLTLNLEQRKRKAQKRNP